MKVEWGDASLFDQLREMCDTSGLRAVLDALVKVIETKDEGLPVFIFRYRSVFEVEVFAPDRVAAEEKLRQARFISLYPDDAFTFVGEKLCTQRLCPKWSRGDKRVAPGLGGDPGQKQDVGNGVEVG